MYGAPTGKTAAADWARDMFSNLDAIILDTETTGIGRDDEAVSIAVVNLRGEVLFDSLVKPMSWISPGASLVHGITNAQVTGAPAFGELHPELDALIDGQELIAYNLDFDWRILKNGCRLSQQRIFRPKASHCAMKQYAQYYGMWNPVKGGYRWQSLTNACIQLGIRPESTHSAAGDCLLTLEVMRRMAAR